MATCNEKA